VREQLELAGLEIETMDRGAALFDVRPALADIAVGAHGDKQALLIRTRQDVLGPVVIPAGG